MSDKIHPIRDGVVMSEGKQCMLDTLADAYDIQAEHGGAPLCVVFAFVSEKGGCKTGYHTLSPVEDRNSLYVARAVSCINMDVGEWDKVSQR